MRTSIKLFEVPVPTFPFNFSTSKSNDKENHLKSREDYSNISFVKRKRSDPPYLNVTKGEVYIKVRRFLVKRGRKIEVYPLSGEFSSEIFQQQI